MMRMKMLVGCLVGSIAASSTQIAFYPPPTIARTVGEQTASSVYKKANPAVVTIRVGEKSHGSGFIISKDGWVITNAHVAAAAPGVVTLLMADGKTKISADVVGFAKGGVDLAVLKISGRRNLPTIKLGNRRSIEVGNQVYAIGTPFDEVNQGSFTTGIVSALRTGIIQHSAPINPGNSGGPLLDGNGEVIGVNQAIGLPRVVCTNEENCPSVQGNVGISYAIAIDVVKAFIADIKSRKLSPISTLQE
jgi:serine protease Do